MATNAPIISSFLAILLENTEQSWVQLNGLGVTAKAFVQQLFLFVRAIHLLRDDACLLCLSVEEDGTNILYASPECDVVDVPIEGEAAHIEDSSEAAAYDANEEQEDLMDPAGVMLRRLMISLRAKTRRKDLGRSGAWSAALLKALCVANRLRSTQPEERREALVCRVVCVKACGDDPVQYLAVMNSIFAAQRADVNIDACMIGTKQSGFMQQASHLTGGVYVRALRPLALAQYLMTACAADASSREFLRLPRATKVDFRASCFCHKRPTSLGYVCSVCLSIFCERIPVCSTCGTEFSVKALGGTPQQVTRS